MMLNLKACPALRQVKDWSQIGTQERDLLNMQFSVDYCLYPGRPQPHPKLPLKINLNSVNNPEDIQSGGAPVPSAPERETVTETETATGTETVSASSTSVPPALKKPTIQRTHTPWFRRSRKSGPCCDKCCTAFLFILAALIAILIGLFDNFVMDSCKNMSRMEADNEVIIKRLESESLDLSKRAERQKRALPLLEAEIPHHRALLEQSQSHLSICRERKADHWDECETYKNVPLRMNRAYVVAAATIDNEVIVSAMMNAAKENAQTALKKCLLDHTGMCVDLERELIDRETLLKEASEKERKIKADLEESDSLQSKYTRQLQLARNYVSDPKFIDLKWYCETANSIIERIDRYNKFVIRLFEGFEQVKVFLESFLRFVESMKDE